MNSSHLEVINLVLKFVTFFKQSKNIIDMDEKWNLWENEYNFAASPPTHEAHLRAKNDYNPLSFKIIYFVVFFENNPFVTFGSSGTICLCLPVEGYNDKNVQILQLYHELTHILHLKPLKKELSYERSFSFLILQEGLALQMSKQMVPGFKDETYISNQKG